MTISRRDALICGTLCFAFASLGLYFAAQRSWWCLSAFYIAIVLGWCERRLTADHRRQLRTHERARRAARIDSLRTGRSDDIGRQSVSLPCCSFYVHSDGEVHGPDCTRPSEGTAA